MNNDRPHFVARVGRLVRIDSARVMVQGVGGTQSTLRDKVSIHSNRGTWYLLSLWKLGTWRVSSLIMYTINIQRLWKG